MGATTFSVGSSVANATISTAMLLAEMLNGAVYVMGEPLAVWFAWTPLTVSAPQSPCLFPGSIWHVKVQDAPPFPGSFVTTAIRFSENPTASDPPGSGLNVMETLFGGGGGGFCTFAVLPPHPASNAIIAVAITDAKTKRTDRWLFTARLPKLPCVIVIRPRRPSSPAACASTPLMSRAPQINKLRHTKRLRRIIDREAPRLESRAARLESHAQSATLPRRQRGRAIVGLGVVPLHFNLSRESHRDGRRQVGIVQ